MRRLLQLVIGVIAILSARSAHAQVCLGFAPFSAGPLRTSVGYQDGDGTDLYRGEVGLGRASSDFGTLGAQLTASRNDPAGFHSSSKRVDGMAGRELSLGGADGAQVCPIARLGYGSASSAFPNGTVDENYIPFGFGGAFGFNMVTSQSSRIVPSLAVEYVGDRVSGTIARAGASQPLPTRTISSGLLTLSLGMGAGAFTVTPYINHTFGVRGTVGVWGVAASANLGTLGR